MADTPAYADAAEAPHPPGALPPDDSRTPYAPEIAVAWRNFFAPIYNGLLQPDDSTLATRGRGRGLRIYDELERDPTCYALLQKRKTGVVSREWTVEPASPSRADKKAAAIVQAQLDALPFDRICLELLDALLKGYAVSEILWDVTGDGVRAVDCVARDARRFAFAADYSLRLLTEESPLYGVALPARKFIVHSFGAKDRNPYGLGLGTRLFWPVFFKRNGLQFWLTFLDKYGSPTAKGTYPSGTSPAAKQLLLQALQSISQEAQIALPEEMNVELLEATRGANGGYAELMNYLDNEMAKCVLGETLTTSTNEAQGSLAASRTHNAVRLEVVAADADLLSATLNNTLIQWISQYNVPNATPPRIWWDVEEPEDLYQHAQADALVAGMGFRPSLEYIRDIYGEGWNEAAASGLPSMPARNINVPGLPADIGRAPDTNATGTVLAEPGDDATVPDHQAAQLDRRLMPVTSQWIDQIRALVDSADSLEAVRDGLLTLYPGMKLDDYAQLMSQALNAATLAGRSDILDQARG